MYTKVCSLFSLVMPAFKSLGDMVMEKLAPKSVEPQASNSSIFLIGSTIIHRELRYPRSMPDASRIEAGDRALIRIVDAALSEAVRLSGAWLACRPGCTQCCMGPFPITQLDARRLRLGLAELEAKDPDRAGNVRARARSAAGLAPGDEEDAPCPALDPATGLCDLYTARPVTCRVFGPPMRMGDGPVGVCELCFQGASEEEIASCATEIPAGELEAELLADLGAQEDTTVALALR
jgi:Fe-S-cluster containining protein